MSDDKGGTPPPFTNEWKNEGHEPAKSSHPSFSDEDVAKAARPASAGEVFVQALGAIRPPQVAAPNFRTVGSSDFARDLARVLNIHSIDAKVGLPDFILASFLEKMLHDLGAHNDLFREWSRA